LAGSRRGRGCQAPSARCLTPSIRPLVRQQISCYDGDAAAKPPSPSIRRASGPAPTTMKPLTASQTAKYTAALEFGEQQVAALIEKHPDFFPIYTTQGKWYHGGELWTDWTGGFLAGMMWQFHRRTGDPAWLGRAQHYSKLLEHRQHDRNVHDLGFIFLS